MLKYFEENSLDWVWTIWWLVHLEKEIWKKVIKNFFKTLKKWWILLLSTKLREKDKEEKIIKESKSIPWIKKTYIYYFEEELVKILEEIWFSLIETLKTNTFSSDYKKRDKWISLICEKNTPSFNFIFLIFVLWQLYFLHLTHQKPFDHTQNLLNLEILYFVQVK